jgi:hypothetical protein
MFLMFVSPPAADANTTEANVEQLLAETTGAGAGGQVAAALGVTWKVVECRVEMLQCKLNRSCNK